MNWKCWCCDAEAHDGCVTHDCTCGYYVQLSTICERMYLGVKVNLQERDKEALKVLHDTRRLVYGVIP